MSLEAMLMNPRKKKAKRAKKARRSAAQKRATKKMIAARKAKLSGKKKVSKKVKAKKVQKRKVRRAKKQMKRHVARKAVKLTVYKGGKYKMNKKSKVRKAKKARKSHYLKIYKGDKFMLNPKKRHHRRSRRVKKNPQMNVNEILQYAAGAGIAIILPKVALKVTSYIPFVGNLVNKAKANVVGKLAIRAAIAYGGMMVEKKTKFKKAGKAIMYASIALAAWDLADSFLGLSTKLPFTKFIGLGEGEMVDGIEPTIGEIEEMGEYEEMAGIEEAMGEIEVEGIEPLSGFGEGSNDFYVQ